MLNTKLLYSPKNWLTVTIMSLVGWIGISLISKLWSNEDA